MMQFYFDEERAAQAAAWLLSRYGKPMEAEKLLALLYLADRQSFIETGYPITGDEFVATPSGPALKRLSELLRDVSVGLDPTWSHCLSQTKDSRLCSNGRSASNSLSETDRGKLSDVLAQHAGQSSERLVRYMRGLPEWFAHSAGVESVDPTVILQDAGHSVDEIAEVARQAASIHWLHSKFGQ